MSKKRVISVTGYCAPHGKEELGEVDREGFFVCPDGCKTKFVTLSDTAHAALQDFVNGREYGVQEIGKILTDETNNNNN